MKINKWLNWFLFGIILSVAISTANLTDADFFTEEFYKSKAVLDCSESYYRNTTEINDGLWKMDTDKFVNYLYFGPNNKKWKFFCIDIDHMKTDSMVAYLNYYNSQNDMELLYTQQITLSNGQNVIKTECRKFDFVGVFIFDQKGNEMYVNSIQLRQSKPVVDFMPRLMRRFLFVFIVYILATILLYPICRKIPVQRNFDKLIDKLVRLFGSINNVIYKGTSKISIVFLKAVRVIAFLFLIIYFNLTSIHVLFPLTNRSRVLVITIVLLVVAITLSNKESQIQDWKNPLVRYWLVYNICVIISDIIVKKGLMYQGWILLFLFGYIIYGWNNQGKISFIKEILLAIHIYFIIVTICCCIFRPDIYLRYQGTFSNPVTFGAYVSIIASLALVELINCLKAEKLPKRIVFFCMEFLIAVSFIWKTQARSALLPILFLVCIYIWQYVVRTNVIRKQFIVTLLMGLIMCMPCYAALDYVLQTVPIELGTTVTFENDGYQPDNPAVLKETQDVSGRGMQSVYAEGLLNVECGSARILQKFKVDSLEVITSGRTLFWKGYLRRMNLVGHDKYAYVMGKRQHPHCSLVMIAYRYGVFSVIPYLFMLIYAFFYAFKYFMEKRITAARYIEYPIAVIAVFLSISLLDVAEYLYSGLGWLLFNISIGCLFCNSRTGGLLKEDRKK